MVVDKKKEEKPVQAPKTTGAPKKVVSKNEVSQFQAQLVQALELNDKLIVELEQKEKEISMFQEVRKELDNVIKQKDEYIHRFQTALEEFKNARLNERKQNIFERWMLKFNLAADQSESVQRMLSKFTSEDELVELERVMQLPADVKRQSNPLPLTQTSAFLSDNPAPNKSGKVFDALSKEEKMDALWDRVAAIKDV